MYGNGPLWLHTGQHINPSSRHCRRRPSLSLIPPHPRHPFMADPFSRSFRGPIKRLAHSARSEMCNVRKKERRGGGRADSKRAYNLFTKVDWVGPPILFSADSWCRESSLQHDKEKRHGSICHEKGWGLISNLNPFKSLIEFFEVVCLVGNEGITYTYKICTVYEQYRTFNHWDSTVWKGWRAFITYFLTTLWLLLTLSRLCYPYQCFALFNFPLWIIPPQCRLPSSSP